MTPKLTPGGSIQVASSHHVYDDNSLHRLYMQKNPVEYASLCELCRLKLPSKGSCSAPGYLLFDADPLHRLILSFLKWAASSQKQQTDCVPSEDSDQPWHSDADAQADLSLRWAHMSFCLFCHDAPQLHVNRNQGGSKGHIHTFMCTVSAKILKLLKHDCSLWTSKKSWFCHCQRFNCHSNRNDKR